MAADKNGDGFVTRHELRDHFKKHAARQAASKVFDRLDRNNDGFLGPRELRRASSRLKRKLRGADTDNDGKISKAEYMAALGHAAQQAHSNRSAIRQAMRAFKAADANHDRKLEASEWPAGAAATFAAVDADSDGTVTGREIAAYMRANNASPF